MYSLTSDKASVQWLIQMADGVCHRLRRWLMFQMRLLFAYKCTDWRGQESCYWAVTMKFLFCSHSKKNFQTCAYIYTDLWTYYAESMSFAKPYSCCCFPNVVFLFPQISLSANAQCAHSTTPSNQNLFRHLLHFSRISYSRKTILQNMSTGQSGWIICFTGCPLHEKRVSLLYFSIFTYINQLQCFAQTC